MEPRKGPRVVLLIVFIGLAIPWFLLKGVPYPPCDNPLARSALNALYDNQRLLHAMNVSNLRLLSDGFKGRYCVATIDWEKDKRGDVPYEFRRGGKNNDYVYMWIEYNGGQTGAIFR